MEKNLRALTMNSNRQLGQFNVLYRAARSLKRSVKTFIHEEHLRSIYRSFADLTMLPEEVYLDNLKLVEPYAKGDGCVIECGVWKGGMIAGMASLLGPSRQYILFDSFQGLPDAKLVDGATAVEWQSKTEAPDYFDNCSASKSFAIEAMKRAGCCDFSIQEGWFNETLANYKPSRQIDVLRLDGDWYESTMTCLTNLFDQVTPGGIIILDDYHIWDGCARALHDFLSAKGATEKLLSLGKVCYLYKQ